MPRSSQTSRGPRVKEAIATKTQTSTGTRVAVALGIGFALGLAAYGFGFGFGTRPVSVGVPKPGAAPAPAGAPVQRLGQRVTIGSGTTSGSSSSGSQSGSSPSQATSSGGEVLGGASSSQSQNSQQQVGGAGQPANQNQIGGDASSSQQVANQNQVGGAGQSAQGGQQQVGGAGQAAQGNPAAGAPSPAAGEILLSTQLDPGLQSVYIACDPTQGGVAQLLNFSQATNQHPIQTKVERFRLVSTDGGLVVGSKGTAYFTNIVLVDRSNGATVMGPVELPAWKNTSKADILMHDPFSQQPATMNTYAVKASYGCTEDAPGEFIGHHYFLQKAPFENSDTIDLATGMSLSAGQMSPAGIINGPEIQFVLP